MGDSAVSVNTSNLREKSTALGLLEGEGGLVDFSEGAGERLATLRPKLKRVLAESHDTSRTPTQREQARVHSFTLRQKMLKLERAEAVALVAVVLAAQALLSLEGRRGVGECGFYCPRCRSWAHWTGEGNTCVRCEGVRLVYVRVSLQAGGA